MRKMNSYYSPVFKFLLMEAYLSRGNAERLKFITLFKTVEIPPCIQDGKHRKQVHSYTSTQHRIKPPRSGLKKQHLNKA